MNGKSYYKIHPTVSRTPALPPPRIELNILQSTYGQPKYMSDDVDVRETKGKEKICPRCPETSSRTIPSMVYDALKCHDHEEHYISPTQNTVLAYPWSANTSVRHLQARSISRSSSLESDILSFISEDNETLAPSPAGCSLMARTAPPFVNVHNARGSPPFTAPVINRCTSMGLGPSVKKPVSTHTPYQGQGPFILGREFTGKYVDPSNGSVYNYKVRYGKNPTASRRLLSKIDDGVRTDTPRQLHSRGNVNESPDQLERFDTPKQFQDKKENSAERLLENNNEGDQEKVTE